MSNIATADANAQVEAAAQEQWLASEPTWGDARVGEGWTAIRVLGTGGYGIVGHWRYTGPENKAFKDIVVKQGLAKNGGLNDDADIHVALAPANSNHIVKMYRHVYTGQGSGTSAKFDPGGVGVHRMFLEYCEGGDLFDRQEVHEDEDEYWNELELWQIFHCLSLGILTMHKGLEDMNPNIPRWAKNELVHFDIKLENILIGGPENDNEHNGNLVYKFADFGLALFVIPPNLQNDAIRQRVHDRGTNKWLFSEQTSFDAIGGDEIPRPWNEVANTIRYRIFQTARPIIGTASNIWQTGAIIHCLMTNVSEPAFDLETHRNWRLQLHNSLANAYLLSHYPTLATGADVEDEKSTMDNEQGKEKLMYSAQLRQLLMECLLIHPEHRPKPEEIVKRTRRGMAAARMNAARAAGASGMAQGAPGPTSGPPGGGKRGRDTDDDNDDDDDDDQNKRRRRGGNTEAPIARNRNNFDEPRREQQRQVSARWFSGQPGYPRRPPRPPANVGVVPAIAGPSARAPQVMLPPSIPQQQRQLPGSINLFPSPANLLPQAQTLGTARDALLNSYFQLTLKSRGGFITNAAGEISYRAKGSLTIWDLRGEIAVAANQDKNRVTIDKGGGYLEDDEVIANVCDSSGRDVLWIELLGM